MKGIVRACLMFLRFSSFVLIIAIGLWHAADFTSKLVADISNWWISSAVSSLVCSFSLIAVLAIAMATIELSLKAETVESSSPASTTEPASSADNQDGPGTYLIAALCLIAAVILPALAIFPVLNLIHFYPHHWWIALPMLSIAWRRGLSHLNLRRLDQSSELTSDLRLSNRISSMVSKAGLEKFELRVRHLPAVYENCQKTFAVAKEREPVGLKVAMATQCCAYSCRGRNVVLMCPVTMEELNNKEVDSIIAHEIGHLCPFRVGQIVTEGLCNCGLLRGTHLLHDAAHHRAHVHDFEQAVDVGAGGLLRGRLLRFGGADRGGGECGGEGEGDEQAGLAHGGVPRKVRHPRSATGGAQAVPARIAACCR